MNLSPKWVERLRTSGYDAVHWSEVGSAEATDEDIANWARTEDRIVLTSDLDFGSLLAATRANSPSVVQLRSAILRPSIVGDAVCGALAISRSDLLEGAFLTFDGNRARLKKLPFVEEPS